MQNTVNLPGQIQVSAENWHNWRAIHAKAQAMAKEADALRKVCGIPETADLVATLGATAELGASAVIIDGNGSPLGKVSVYWRDAYAVKATFVSRVS
jgi:hypothetical protein